MCIICVDYQKQLITADEARRNMTEMVVDPEHEIEIETMLREGEDRAAIEKIANAPARYSFKVDVGDIPPGKTEAFLREAKRRLKDKRNPLGED